MTVHETSETADRTTPPPDGGARGRHADRASDIPARGWKDVALRVKDEVRDDHVVLSAAGVAFYGFLSLIPGLAAVVTVYGLFADPAQVERRVEDLFGALPDEAQQLLTSQLESIVDQSSSALTTTLVVSLVLSVWAASSGIGHLIEAINVAYDEDDQRGFVARRALALLFTVGAIVFVVLTIGVITAVPSLLAESDLPSPLQWVLRLATWAALMVVFAVALALLYRFGPYRDAPKWRWVTWGSGIAVVLWVVASIGFRVYTSQFGSYNETYGSLAAVVVMLLWLFITAFVVLLGAQINAELEHQTLVDTTQGPPRPIGQRDAVMADTVGRSSDGDDGAP